MQAQWSPLDLSRHPAVLPTVQTVGRVSPRKIVVSSRAMGRRDKVTVLVYDTLAEMRAAASAYNGTDNHDSIGVTQVACWVQTGRTKSVIVRLARDYIGTLVISHEIHHAATALYGAHVGDRISTARHLTHCNEPFAHLFSDLLARLVDRLYELGYYP